MQQTYTNPKTGEKIMWDGKAWVPVPKADAQPDASPVRPPSYAELMQGPSMMLGRLGEVAGAGIKKLEMGSLQSEAAGNRGTALLKREGANLLRPAESLGRLGGGATALPPPSVAVTGVGLPAAVDVVSSVAGLRKGEDLPSRVERGAMGGAQLAGMAAGALEGGKGAGTAKSAKYANVVAELEDFRSMVKEKPSKAARVRANVRHVELKQAIDGVWEPIHKALDSLPGDPAAATKALEPLARKLGKEVAEDMMPTSESGASQAAPLFSELKSISKKLWQLQGKDPVITQLARTAKEKVDAQMFSIAEKAGLKEPFARAQALTRKMENIKFHTAYNAIKTPTGIWELGGAIAGAVTGAATEGVGTVAGAYLGHHLGRAAGKMPEASYITPKKSIAAEGALWKELGQEPPKGYDRKTFKVEPRTLPAKPASTVPERAGTAAGAKADTNYINQARTKLGSKATIHDIILEAQRLKDAAKPK